MGHSTPHFWQDGGIIAAVLQPFASLYQWGYRLRRQYTEPEKMPIPVLCIGNLVAGGAGKTPCAIAIGQWLQARRINACFLSKGYGGQIDAPTRVDTSRHTAAEVGDEPLLLAHTLPTIISKDRVAGARKAVEDGFSFIVMDDGFQNPTLHQDAAFIVIDRDYPFGNRRTFPAGPLREPVLEGLKRASAVILLHREGRDAVSTPALPDGIPIVKATRNTVYNTPIAGKPVFAFTGIARPEQFFASLSQMGATVVDSAAFPDHHTFTEKELGWLERQAKATNTRLVTTAKDAARIPAGKLTEIIIADLTITWHNADLLETLLLPLIPKE